MIPSGRSYGSLAAVRWVWQVGGVRAFDTLFPDIASREFRAFRLPDARGREHRYVVQEFYCEVPRCACGRAGLIVIDADTRTDAARFEYALERNGAELWMDPEDQGGRADQIWRFLQHAMSVDAEYRAMLRAHHAMWKRGINGPPPARAERPKPAPRSGDLERVIAKAGAETKAQQRFRKLLEKVDRLRQRLAQWKQQRGDIDREVALYHAVFLRHAAQGGEIVRALDAAYPSLNKREKKQVSDLIADIAEMLIVQGGNDELKPIYNRHARSNFDANVAAAEAEDAEELRSTLEERFGIEIADEDAGSVDQIRAAVRAQMEAQDAADAARRAKRKKTSKQVQAEERRAQEQKSADKAVQDVYRTLARALHPDHEQDAAEQARKTRLMSEVNVAYEAKDLLRLLALQLELEQVDEAHIRTMAEDRLRHFSRVLDEQARQLAAELEGIEAPYRMELGVALSTVISPERVIVRIRADARTMEEQIRRGALDLVMFQDVAKLKAFLRAMR